MDPIADPAGVWVALIGAAASIVASVLAFLSHRRARDARDEAGAANAAVNNRPPGSPTIYDLVAEIRQEARAENAALRSEIAGVHRRVDDLVIFTAGGRQNGATVVAALPPAAPATTSTPDPADPDIAPTN